MERGLSGSVYVPVGMNLVDALCLCFANISVPSAFVLLSFLLCVCFALLLREAPGEGDTDFLPIIRALQTAGYMGVMSIEAFGFSEDPKLVLPRSRKYLDAVIEAS